MGNDESKSGSWPTEIVQHLGSIYRHMLPGVLVIAATTGLRRLRLDRNQHDHQQIGH
jgi:hypothetical protein